jgi:hypothetical protein
MKKKIQKDRPLIYRFDTKVSVIGKKYDTDFGADANKKLGDFLIEKGYPSLAGMLQDA